MIRREFIALADGAVLTDSERAALMSDTLQQIYKWPALKA
jgi:hypothetical protein